MNINNINNIKNNIMTNETANLPANLSDKALAYIQAVNTGAVGGANPDNNSPYAYLNIAQENGRTLDNGKEIPFGHFHVSSMDVTSKSITIRPLGMWYKVIRKAGEEANWKVIGETTYFMDFSGEHPDTFGTLDCGRKFGKDAKSLTDDEKSNDRKTKGEVYADVFALVEFPDTSEPVLCKWRVKASKMARVSRAFNRKVSGVDFPQLRKYKIITYLPKDDPTLSPQEKAQARNSYVNIVVEPMMDQTYSPADIAEVGGELLEFISEHNKEIMNRHAEVMSDRSIGDFIEGDFEVVSDDEGYNTGIRELA